MAQVIIACVARTFAKYLSAARCAHALIARTTYGAAVAAWSILHRTVYGGESVGMRADGELKQDVEAELRCHPDVDETGIAAVPHLGYGREGVVGLPQIVFRPVNPLTQAGFAVV